MSCKFLFPHTWKCRYWKQLVNFPHYVVATWWDRSMALSSTQCYFCKLLLLLLLWMSLALLLLFFKVFLLIKETFTVVGIEKKTLFLYWTLWNEYSIRCTSDTPYNLFYCHPIVHFILDYGLVASIVGGFSCR